VISLLVSVLIHCASTHMCSATYTKVDHTYHVMYCDPSLIAQHPIDVAHLSDQNGTKVTITRSNTCKVS